MNNLGFTKKEMIYGIVAIVIVVGLGFWLTSYEAARSRDAERMSVITQLYSMLEQYHFKYASYPSVNGGNALVEDTCFNPDFGFVSATSDNCFVDGQLYHYSGVTPTGGRNDVYEYSSLSVDGQSLCESSVGCPQFSLKFYQETGAFTSGRGFHTISVLGIQ